jgi:type I restriction enzyme S subunit
MCTSSGSADVVGKSALFEADGWVGSFGAFCAVIRPNGNECLPDYLKHVLRAPAFLSWARSSLGANIKNIRKSELELFRFHLPMRSDQKRIAVILDKADSLRRKRQEAIRLADEFLRTVFIDMFGGLDTASNPQVELADVVTLDAPMVDPTSDEFADMLHVGPDRIEKGNGQLLACETARAEGLTSKKFFFDERYVLYSKIRPGLKKCALAEFRGLCSADMYPVRPSGNEVTREFIWGLLLSVVFDRYVSTLPDRANIPKLNRVELNAFQFRLPPIESQRKYSSIVQRTMALKRQHNMFLKQAIALPVSLGFFS